MSSIFCKKGVGPRRVPVLTELFWEAQSGIPSTQVFPGLTDCPPLTVSPEEEVVVVVSDGQVVVVVAPGCGPSGSDGVSTAL